MHPYQDEIEAIVDRLNLQTVIEALSAVCDAKADHLRSNWQDGRAAKKWEQVASALDLAAIKAEGL